MRHVRTLAATTAVANDSPLGGSLVSRIEVEVLPNLPIRSTGLPSFLLTADYSTLNRRHGTYMAVLSQARV
jgi:hypothetical protein